MAEISSECLADASELLRANVETQRSTEVASGWSAGSVCAEAVGSGFHGSERGADDHFAQQHHEGWFLDFADGD